jgi:hypothetical protein
LGRGSIVGRAEPCITVAAARSSLAIEHELRCFGQSGGSAASTRWELMRNAVSQEAPVPGRASRRRRSVHISHSSFAGLEERFTIRLTTSSRNAGVAGLLNSLESQVTPKLLSPIDSRSVPTRSGCVRCPLASGRRRHHSLEGPVDLAARRSIRQHQRRRPGQTPVERVAP